MKILAKMCASPVQVASYGNYYEKEKLLIQ